MILIALSKMQYSAVASIVASQKLSTTLYNEKEYQNMAKPGRATQAKRSRELAKKEKAHNKDERRAAKKEEKAQRTEHSFMGEDPDLIGIIPGPQKPYGED